MNFTYPLSFGKKSSSFLLGAWLLLLLFGLSISSCNDDEKIPDVRDIHIESQVYRFDSIYYHTDSADIPAFYQELQKNHPEFLKTYIRFMTAPSMRVKDTIDFLHAMQHPGLRRLYDTTEQIIGDFSKERADFAQAFKYVKYYLPKRPTPNIYTVETEFAIGAYPMSKDLFVGLDMFLGKDFPYDPMVFPDYIKRTMTKENIVPYALRAYADRLSGNIEGEEFLDYIISNGKALYLLDHFLPATPDSVIIRYTKAQYEWCQENEFNMWSHFIHEGLLYSTKMKDFRKLITPSPNSTGMPDEAPGRTGNYMGWQIIKAYMKRYPKTTFEELLALKDSKLILKKSKYKPKGK